MKKYLTEHQVAKITNRAAQTLRNDRCRGVGIPFIRLGRRVVYDPEVVEAYIQSCRVSTQRWRPK